MICKDNMVVLIHHFLEHNNVISCFEDLSGWDCCSPVSFWSSGESVKEKELWGLVVLSDEELETIKKIIFCLFTKGIFV